MGKSGEFFTFDEVLEQLGVNETKLKRLVSEGEIRAFREGDQMKFRRADVENLDLAGSRTEEETGVIDLSAGRDDSSETLTDDLIFDEADDGLDLTSDTGLQTAEISSQDTFVDEPIGMSTEPLGVEPGDMTEVVDIDEIEEEERSQPRGRTREAAPAVRRGPPPEPKDTGWAVVMTLAALVMIGGLIVVLGIRDNSHADLESRAPELANDVGNLFGGYQE